MYYLERSSRHYLSWKRQGVDYLDMRLILSSIGFVYAMAVGAWRGRGQRGNRLPQIVAWIDAKLSKSSALDY